MDFLFNQYYLQMTMFILINAILGVSMYLTMSTGQLSLGAAGFMSIGAYVSALLTMKAGVPLYLAVPVGGAAATLLAVVIGIPTTRLRGIYLAIATLGLGEVVRVVMLNLKITNGALGLSGIPSMSIMLSKALTAIGMGAGIAGISARQLGTLAAILLLAALLLFIVFFAVRLNNSRWGRAFAAIKADEYAAEVSGVNIRYYKLLAFVMGAFVAGIAGGLAAHITFFIGPKDFAYHRAVEILLFAVLGGSDTVWGPLLGSFILTLLPEALRFATEYRSMIYGAILVIMMAFRPQGLISEETIRYWRERFNKTETAAAAREEVSGRSV